MTDESLTIRLYDKIEEIRGEVASMASDVRNLATKIEPVVTQVVDHEGRIRVLERTTTTMEALDARDKQRDEDIEKRMRTVERGSWKVAGIAAVVELVAGSGIALWIVEAVAKH